MYILFAGTRYGACGGAYDVFFVGKTLESCKKNVNKAIKKHSEYGEIVFWHIYDVNKNKIVERSDESLYQNNGKK